jgi:hypothetical protein
MRHEINLRLGLCAVCFVLGLFLGGLLTSVRARNLLAAKDIQIRGLNRLLEDTKHYQEVWKRLATKDYRPMPKLDSEDF